MSENTEQTGSSWANPAALGFIALAVSLFSLSPVLCGWVNPVSFPFTAAWGIVALIALIVVTIIFFKNRTMRAVLTRIKQLYIGNGIIRVI